MIFTTVRKNPFGIAKKNNHLRSAIQNFADSGVNCAKISTEDYKSPAQCLWSVNTAIRNTPLKGVLEAHMKNGEVYIMRSEKVDRTKIHGNYNTKR